MGKCSKSVGNVWGVGGGGLSKKNVNVTDAIPKINLHTKFYKNQTMESVKIRWGKGAEFRGWMQTAQMAFQNESIHMMSAGSQR